MTDAHAALAAKARAAAVEGPWAVWHDLDHQGFKTVGDAQSYRELLENGDAEDCNPVAHVYTDADAEYIAAASPDVVLGLIRDLADANARIEAALAWHDPAYEGNFAKGDDYAQGYKMALREVRRRLAPAAAHPEHDHANEPKVWCVTHQHTHIASIPRFTYQCKSCGWGQWYKPDAEDHERRCHGHETYEVEHVVRPEPPRPQDNPESVHKALVHLLFDQVPEDWDENDIGILAAFHVIPKEPLSDIPGEDVSSTPSSGTFLEPPTEATREALTPTDKQVEAAAKVLWIAGQGDPQWAAAVVDDVFSPADDWPDEAIHLGNVARAALAAAFHVTPKIGGE